MSFRRFFKDRQYPKCLVFFFTFTEYLCFVISSGRFGSCHASKLFFRAIHQAVNVKINLTTWQVRVGFENFAHSHLNRCCESFPVYTMSDLVDQNYIVLVFTNFGAGKSAPRREISLSRGSLQFKMMPKMDL